MVHDLPGDIEPRRPLQSPPPGNAVHFQHEDATVTRRQQVDPRIVCAHDRRGAERELRPCRRQLELPRRSTARDVGAPFALGRPALDCGDHSIAKDEGAHIGSPVVHGTLDVEDRAQRFERL